MLYAGAFSCATRFISLSAVKASVVKKFEVLELLLELSAFKGISLVPTFTACLYHVGAGMMVYQKARREEHFAWYVQLAADVVRVQALTGAMVLSAALVFLVAIDIRATFRAAVTLAREIWEARRRGGITRPVPGIEVLAFMARVLSRYIIGILCLLVLINIFFTLSPDGALSFGVAPAASGGTSGTVL
ncbi:hypothetical protein MTO96_017009 [Rhipicephalus appendiculatus]